ncbi:hypothetical protein M378DRAFT_67224 [Amanita muscaria Koide BX008]|uniref:Ribosomal RNA-processing protein 7 n=1 Tax=Amanita muscaria (strain Koide BX008) TaxID=946122 RepID=A0A0C2TT42_AMAMK|nr:hypothetical protein M378DRAFT_67224 [Amanita muscaria Koide BX008]
MTAEISLITISGFTILPIKYSSDSSHYLYVRKHAGPKSGEDKAKKGRELDLPDGRTLFVVNIPPDATERELILFFKFCGTVERVLFNFMGSQPEKVGSEDENEESGMDKDEEEQEQDDESDGEEESSRKKKRRKTQKDEVPKVVPLPTTRSIRKLRKTGRTAHIIFLDPSSLDRLFSQPNLFSKARPWPASEEPTGLGHYTAQYAAFRPPLDAVKEHADSYIRVYDYEQEKAKQKSRYRKGEAIVDEDGFTLVVRGGAYGRTLGGGVAVASKKFQESGVASEKGSKKKKKASVGKDGFYAFQKAEKQRNVLIELKKKWEEDKAKIEKLKASRRFRPY